MRTNAPDSWTTHTNTREAERTQGYTHMEACSMEPDGLRTGCERVPLHAIQVFIRLLSVPFLFDCVVARLDAGPSNCVAGTVGRASDLSHLLNEYAYECIRMRQDAHCGAEVAQKRDRRGTEVARNSMHTNASECALYRMRRNAYKCM